MPRTPKNSTILWIEADPVFGGSRSQVQFPEELAPFFRLPTQRQIGASVQRAVTIAGIPFPAKKMDFHHNDVWRLNLPTPRQGLGGYAGRILVFQRTREVERFNLWTVEPGTPLARQLVAAARRDGAIGSRIRDDGSERTYGYF